MCLCHSQEISKSNPYGHAGVSDLSSLFGVCSCKQTVRTKSALSDLRFV